MNPFDPTNLISLRGLGTMRGFTASLPTDTVRKLLPHGLELGAQSVTAPGTHPVLFGFNDMFRLHWSFPFLLPNETYRELSVGVPFAYLTQGQVTSQSPGPYYFMPQLYLDNLFAVVGGTLLWGFNKQLANFLVTAERYDVSATGSGDSITSLEWTNVGEHRPLHEFPRFDLHGTRRDRPVLRPLGLQQDVGPRRHSPPASHHAGGRGIHGRLSGGALSRERTVSGHRRIRAGCIRPSGAMAAQYAVPAANVRIA
jgi:hypothetical protein